MKLISLLENYGNASPLPTPPLLLLTDVSLLKSGKPFFVPDDGHEYRAFPSMAIRICRLGKSIPARFAHRYYQEVAPALNIRDITLLSLLRKKSLPWTEAVAFDYSTPTGDFISLPQMGMDGIKLTFRHLDNTGKEISSPIMFDPKNLQIGADKAIEVLSRRFTLKDGDIIFLGHTSDSFLLSPRQTVEAFTDTKRNLFVKLR